MLPLSVLDIDLIDGDRGHEYPKNTDFADEGFCLFLSAQNVTRNGFQFDESVFIMEAKHRRLRKGTVERGDIIVTTRGTLGDFAYFDDFVPYDVMRINSGMVIIQNKSTEVPTPFLYEVLQSAFTERQLALSAYGSAQPQLNLNILRQLLVVLPPKEEQVALRNQAAAAHARLDGEKSALRKLRTLKQGLMDDLLTGRVRVSVPEEANP